MQLRMKLTFDPTVKAKASGIKLGYAVLDSVKITPSDVTLLERMKTECEALRKRMTIEQLNSDTLVAAYRKLYWQFGIDPTKWRPSGEALMRRVLEGRELYRVNNAVDVCNLLSIKSKLSIGLHDMRFINRDELIVRTAKAGEGFVAIGSKGAKQCTGGELCVSDSERIIDLAYSTSSSDVSKIRNDTTRLLVVVYAPTEANGAEVRAAVDEYIALIKGTVIDKGLASA